MDAITPGMPTQSEMTAILSLVDSPCEPTLLVEFEVVVSLDDDADESELLEDEDELFEVVEVVSGDDVGAGMDVGVLLGDAACSYVEDVG